MFRGAQAMTSEQAIHDYATRGDAEAFRVLVDEYQGLVYAAARRRLENAADIDDVVQVTFLKLSKAAGTIRRNLSSWLYTTAINTANDLIRRDQTRRRHEALAVPPAITDEARRQEWQALSLRVDEAIVELAEPHRTLLVDHFLRGRSQRDLASDAGTSQRTIQRRLRAAVDALRERLVSKGHMAISAALTADLTQFARGAVPPPLTSELMKIGLTGLGVKGSRGLAHWAFSLGTGVKIVAGAVVVILVVVFLAYKRGDLPGGLVKPVPAPGTAPAGLPGVPELAEPMEVFTAALRNLQAIETVDMQFAQVTEGVTELTRGLTMAGGGGIGLAPAGYTDVIHFQWSGGKFRLEHALPGSNFSGLAEGQGMAIGNTIVAYDLARYQVLQKDVGTLAVSNRLPPTAYVVPLLHMYMVVPGTNGTLEELISPAPWRELARRARIVGQEARDGHACVIVEIENPTRVTRVFYAKDLEYFPYRFETLGNNDGKPQANTIVKATRTMEVHGAKIIVPLEIVRNYFTADGQEIRVQQMKVDEKSLRVNEAMDESVFRLSAAGGGQRAGAGKTGGADGRAGGSPGVP
jgi:RNA polymerase sigma factor (sigma-70 family)